MVIPDEDIRRFNQTFGDARAAVAPLAEKLEELLVALKEEPPAVRLDFRLRCSRSLGQLHHEVKRLADAIDHVQRAVRT